MIMACVQIYFIDVGNGSTTVLRYKGFKDLGLIHTRLSRGVQNSEI